MLHENRLFCLPFLIPCTFCDEMVTGDHCPSWRGSRVVEFKIWLNTTRRVPVLKWLIPIRIKRRKNKTTIKRQRTEQLLFFFACRFKIHLSSICFLRRKVYCNESRPYKENSSYSCCTRADGNTTSLRLSTTTGREQTVPGRALPHTPLELRTSS